MCGDYYWGHWPIKKPKRGKSPPRVLAATTCTQKLQVNTFRGDGWLWCIESDKRQKSENNQAIVKDNAPKIYQ